VPPQGGRKHPQQDSCNRTTNILFICRGAFSGLADHFALGKGSGIGYGAGGAVFRRTPDGSHPARSEPEDPVKFRLIPEFIGRCRGRHARRIWTKGADGKS